MSSQQKQASDVRKLLDVLEENVRFSKGKWWRGFFFAQYVMFFANCLVFGYLSPFAILGKPLSSFRWLLLLQSISIFVYIPTLLKVDRHLKSVTKRLKPLRETMEIEMTHLDSQRKQSPDT